MAKRDTYVARAEALLQPIMEANSFELVDVEYVKEGSDYYLRAYIDKEGGIDINDCELVSRAFEAELDREDFIEDAYILEVSSPGLTRPIKKDKDFDRNMGKEVELHLYKPLNGEKLYVGTLAGYDKENIIIKNDEDEEMNFKRTDISLVRPYIEF